MARIWEFYLERPELALLLAGVVIFFSLAIGLAVAALLLRLANERKARRWHRLEQTWQTATVAVVSGDAGPETVWSLVRQRDQLFFVSFLLRFARLLAGTERRVVDELAAPYLDRVEAQLASRSPERRARAVQTLSLLGGPKYIARQIVALDDHSPLVAMVAARALARKESPEFAVAILERLDRFGHWRPSFLASMLASVGPALAPALREALVDRRRDPRSRCVAADALRELHDFEAADAAAAVLAETRHRDLLAAALGLLAEIGRPEHLPAIRAHLESGEAIVRARAAAALGHVGAPEDIDRLIAALEDPSAWVALRAAEALKKAGSTHALEAMAGSAHARAPLARAILVAGHA